MARLSTSDARSEALVVVVRLLIQELSPQTLERVHQQAVAEGEDIGHRQVLEEIRWLFMGWPDH